MSKKAYLVLENGKTFTGQLFGSFSDTTDIMGELVFTTGMNGYLETVTDPSHHGQMVVSTFPLIGNYGVISNDFESDNIHVAAYIVKYPCQEPSNFRSEEALDNFFAKKGITGLSGIDTRVLTKIIRDHGVLKGQITTKTPAEADLQAIKAHKVKNATAAVSTKAILTKGAGDLNIALLDLGVKNSTINALVASGATVTIYPHNTSGEDILATKPDGIIISSGPLSPNGPDNQQMETTIKTLQNANIPMLAIDTGHLLLAQANGYHINKLKFGSRGNNQSVKCTKTGKLYITQHNHQYYVDADSKTDNRVSFVNVNTGICEGMDYGMAWGVQFVPGAGPTDTSFLLDMFIERVKENATR